MNTVFQSRQAPKRSVRTWTVALAATFAVFLIVPLALTTSARLFVSFEVLCGCIDSWSPEPPPAPPSMLATDDLHEPASEQKPETHETPQDDLLRQISLSQLERAMDGGMDVGIGRGLQTASNRVAETGVFDLSGLDKIPTSSFNIEPVPTDHHPTEFQESR